MNNIEVMKKALSYMTQSGFKTGTNEVIYALRDAIAKAEDVLNTEGAIVNGAIYTTPPAAQRKWIGLTDKERDAIFELHHTSLGGWDYSGDEVMYDRHFEDAAAAIEAKLKDKNNG